jgi:hypothetical protein
MKIVNSFMGILIIFLFSFFTQPVFSKEIILNCKAHTVQGHYKSGRVSNEPNKNTITELIKLDTRSKDLMTYNPISKKFLLKNVEWDEAFITWESKYPDVQYYNKLNRLTGDYQEEYIYTNDATWKKLITFFKCDTERRKF